MEWMQVMGKRRRSEIKGAERCCEKVKDKVQSLRFSKASGRTTCLYLNRRKSEKETDSNTHGTKCVRHTVQL